MNKFKKVLLGALSVLTLGLFVATGAKVNAAVSFGGTHDHEWAVQDLFATAGGSDSATALSDSDGIFSVDGGSFEVYESCGVTLVTSSANGTNYTFDWIAISGGSRTMTLSVPDGADEVDITMFWANVKKGNAEQGGSNRNIAIAGGYDADSYTLNNATPSNTAQITMPKKNLTVYKASFTYSSNVTLSLASDCTFLGAYADEKTISADSKCTITFNANGGTCAKTTEDAVQGSNYALPTATKENYYLAGWSDGTTTFKGTFTVPTTASVSLTAVWEGLIVMTKECKLDSTSSVDDCGFISLVNKGFQSGKGTASFNGNEFTAATKGLKFDTSETLTFTLNKASTVYLLFSTNYSGKKVAFDSPLYTQSFEIPSDGLVTLKLAKGSHTIRRGDAEVYLFYIGVVETDDTASAVTSSIAAQFDDDSAPTKLRLIGIITGLQPAEYAEISNVTFTFDFNNNVEPYTKRCTQLYKSVASLKSDFAAGNYKLYVVLTIDGVSKYTASGDKYIENITMTIKFEDGTQKIVTRDDVLLAPIAQA